MPPRPPLHDISRNICYQIVQVVDDALRKAEKGSRARRVDPKEAAKGQVDYVQVRGCGTMVDTSGQEGEAGMDGARRMRDREGVQDAESNFFDFDQCREAHLGSCDT